MFWALIEVAIGVALLLWARRRIRVPHQIDPASDQKWIDLHEQCQKLQSYYAADQAKLKTAIEAIELNQRITHEAIKREERAKAALRATLKRDGCTQPEIDDVIRTIEQE